MAKVQDAHEGATLDMFQALCIGLDTPRSLRCYLLVKYQEFSQLMTTKIHPTEYNDADSFHADYIISNFVKKLPIKIAGVDTRQIAVQVFKQSELQCRETNDRIEAWMQGSYCLLNPAVARVLHTAQQKIFNLLSDEVVFSTEQYSWGPGATFDLKRSSAYPDTKMTVLPFTVTGSALKYAAKMIKEDLHWSSAIIDANPTYKGEIFTILPGGRYDTVPKTALTDRSILVEPRLNTILQKRVGAELRKRLKTVDVDLDDQSRNQTLASWSYNANYATLDLSSASDTVSRRLVELLLPPEWFVLCDDLRSKWYQDDQGTWQKLEKFSSMGNGFTFELESLIYWALAASVNTETSSTTIGIYGDDIICHQRSAPLLEEVLGVCGFTLNRDKSFSSGCFFESCGKHYFKGHDVTPAYQKELLRDGPSVSRAGNRLLRLAYRLSGHVSFDKRIRGAWERARRMAASFRVDEGPFIGEGDGYFEVPTSELSERSRTGPFGLRVRVACFTEQRRFDVAHDYSLLALSFWKPIEEEWWLTDSSGNRCFSLQVKQIRDPVLSIKRQGKGAKMSTPGTPAGYLPSRRKATIVREHRWVYEHPSYSLLDW